MIWLEFVTKLHINVLVCYFHYAEQITFPMSNVVDCRSFATVPWELEALGWASNSKQLAVFLSCHLAAHHTSHFITNTRKKENDPKFLYWFHWSSSPSLNDIGEVSCLFVFLLWYHQCSEPPETNGSSSAGITGCMLSILLRALQYLKTYQALSLGKTKYKSTA